MSWGYSSFSSIPAARRHLLAGDAPRRFGISLCCSGELEVRNAPDAEPSVQVKYPRALSKQRAKSRGEEQGEAADFAK
jgi:hypothetical protein